MHEFDLMLQYFSIFFVIMVIPLFGIVNIKTPIPVIKVKLPEE